ncbi:MAG TPA: 50S ribosomal protein L10 [Candidatus Dormibacteraeota bacterium]|nr:50S ribosomal protein L10 [Candidatus Dormibacteraeota bacterium]
MPTKRKADQIELLTEKFKMAKSAVLTYYRGMTVAQLEDLREKLRAGDVEYRVVKNTLARQAAVAAGHPSLGDSLVGPTAIAFGYDDISTPSKLLGEYARATRIKELEVVGALVEGRVLNADQVKQLSDLPPREVLIAQLMGTMQTPMGQLVATIQAPVQQLLGQLEAYKNKLEAA